ncbi:MAG: histidine phosphatase family protein [Lachnospiraceae bacterium]|nr:histidine phosphatase family protein [Lachnospiraceae bacterium]
MKIYLIRHGRQNSKLCNVDVDLCEEGFRQAALLGERLAKEGIQVVYSSGLKRAVQTAQAANLYWNVEHYMYPELREISFGKMEGLSDEEIAVRFAAFQAEQKKMEYDIPYPGGESAGDVVRRVIPVFRQIAESGYEKVAVVTHGGVIRSMVTHYLGMDMAKWRTLGTSLENCSITELEYHPGLGRFTLERFNDYAHLQSHPELLRSAWVDAEN